VFEAAQEQIDAQVVEEVHEEQQQGQYVEQTNCKSTNL